MKNRDDSKLGNAKKAALCDACGTCFSSVTSFVIHQNWEYTPSGARLRCVSDPHELAELNIVMGKRGRYTINPDSEWWNTIKEAHAKLDEDEADE